MFLVTLDGHRDLQRTHPTLYTRLLQCFEQSERIPLPAWPNMPSLSLTIWHRTSTLSNKRRLSVITAAPIVCSGIAETEEEKQIRQSVLTATSRVWQDKFVMELLVPSVCGQSTQQDKGDAVVTMERGSGQQGVGVGMSGGLTGLGASGLSRITEACKGDANVMVERFMSLSPYEQQVFRSWCSWAITAGMQSTLPVSPSSPVTGRGDKSQEPLDIFSTPPTVHGRHPSTRQETEIVDSIVDGDLGRVPMSPLDRLDSNNPFMSNPFSSIPTLPSDDSDSLGSVELLSMDCVSRWESNDESVVDVTALP